MLSLKLLVMETTTYSQTKREGNTYKVLEIKETAYELSPLSGEGIITHVGGNGRFKFKHLGFTFATEFDTSVCIIDDEDKGKGNIYYDCSKLIFNIDIKEKWSKLYIYHIDQDSYWKAI